VAVVSTDEGMVYDWRDHCVQFEVMNPGQSEGQVRMTVAVESDLLAQDLQTG
jgi:hypothetical protein